MTGYPKPQIDCRMLPYASGKIENLNYVKKSEPIGVDLDAVPADPYLQQTNYRPKSTFTSYELMCTVNNTKGSQTDSVVVLNNELVNF